MTRILRIPRPQSGVIGNCCNDNEDGYIFRRIAKILGFVCNYCHTTWRTTTLSVVCLLVTVFTVGNCTVNCECGLWYGRVYCYSRLPGRSLVGGGWGVRAAAEPGPRQPALRYAIEPLTCPRPQYRSTSLSHYTGVCCLSICVLCVSVVPCYSYSANLRSSFISPHLAEPDATVGTTHITVQL